MMKNMKEGLKEIIKSAFFIEIKQSMVLIKRATLSQMLIVAYRAGQLEVLGRYGKAKKPRKK